MKKQLFAGIREGLIASSIVAIVCVSTTIFSGGIHHVPFVEGCKKLYWGFPIHFITDADASYSITLFDEVNWQLGAVNILILSSAVLFGLFTVKAQYTRIGSKEFLRPAHMGILLATGLIILILYIINAWNNNTCPRQTTPSEWQSVYSALCMLGVICWCGIMGIYTLSYTYVRKKYHNHPR